MKVCLNAYMQEQWLNILYDTNQTPFIAVDTDYATRPYLIPESLFTEDSHSVILNLSAAALSFIEFDKEFGFINAGVAIRGESMDIQIPCETVTCVYSMETGFGIEFPGDLILIDPGEANVEEGISTEIDNAPKTKKPNPFRLV